MKCSTCSKDFIGARSTAKYCSDKCKQESYRNTKDVSVTKSGTPIKQSVTVTTTDKLFNDELLGYYIFGEVETRTCFVCNKEFKTALSMLKTCSPAHQDRLLQALTA